MGLQWNNNLALLRRTNTNSSEERRPLVHSRHCAKPQPLTACHKKPGLLQGVPVTPSPPLPQGRACSLCQTEPRGKSSPKSESSPQALDLTLKIAALTCMTLGLLAFSLCLISLTTLSRRIVSGMYKSTHEALLCWLKHVQNKLCQVLPPPSLREVCPARTARWDPLWAFTREKRERETSESSRCPVAFKAPL